MPRKPDDPTAPADQSTQSAGDIADQVTADREKQAAARAKAEQQAQQKQQQSDDGGLLGVVKTAAQAAIPGLSGIDLGQGTAPPGIAQQKYVTRVASEAQKTPPWQAVENSPPGDVFKQGVQWGAAALQAPYESLVAQARGAAKEVSDQGLSALNPFGDQTPEAKKTGTIEQNPITEQTTIGQMATGKSAGEGFLPSTESPAGKAQAEAARANSPYTIGGSAWTPGRALANVVTEPGTTPFNVLSGAVDATSQWFLDPANKALGATSEARAASKTVQFGEEGADIEKAWQNGGKAVEGIRGANTPDEVKLFAPSLSTPVAQRLANASDDQTRLGILKGEAASGPGGTTKISAAGQVSFLQQAGGHYGLTKYSDPLTAKEYLASGAGDTLRSKVMATDGNMGDLWRTFNKAPVEYQGGSGNFYKDLSQAVTDAKAADDPHIIDNVLNQSLGVNQKQVPSFGLGYQYRQVAARTRSLGLVPEGSNINWAKNPNQVVEQIDRLMQNARVPVDTRNDLIHQYLTNPASRASHENIANTASSMMEEGFKAAGMPEDAAKQMARYSRDSDEKLRIYAVNQEAEGGPVTFPGLVDQDGNLINWAEHPSNINEILNSTTAFPNWRDVGRDVSENRALYENGLVKAGTALGDKFMGLWKPMRIARPALVARILGDEQLSMAVRGFDALPNHPLAAVAWSMGTPNSGIAHVVDKIAGIGKKLTGGGAPGEAGMTTGEADRAATEGLEAYPQSGVGRSSLATFIEHAHTQIAKGTNDVYGAPFDPGADDAFAKYVGNGVQRYAGDSKPFLSANVFSRVQADHPMAAQGLAEDLNRMANPITQHALNDTDQGFDWFWNGAGKSLREDMAQNTGFRPLGDDQDWAKQYLGLQAQNAQSMTGGDPRLLSALSGDKPMIGDQYLTRGGTINPQAVSAIQDVLAEGAGPDYVKVADNLLSPAEGGKAGQWAETKEAVQHTFGTLIGTPSRVLSRSPAYRQEYWNNVHSLMPLVGPEDQAKVIGAAEQANLGKSLIPSGDTLLDKLKNTASTVAEGDPRTLNLDQLDTAAKGRTLDSLAGNLHDLNNRGMVWDQLRLVAPFGDAWAKIMGRWSRAVYQQPEVLRRAEQVVEGARGAGFFRKDPTTGEEAFILPGTEWATEQATGVPAPMTAPVSGLSIIGEGLPGIGPAASVPAALLLKDTPTWQSIKDQVFPFGEPKETGNIFPDTVEALNPFPSFTNRLFAAASDPERNREMGNSVGWVMRYNLSTGKYNTNSPEAIDKLYKDSVSQAQKIEVARGVVQAFSPSAPVVDWQVVDKNGKQKSGRELVNEFQKLLQGKGSYDDAYGKFIDRHGAQNMMLTQAFSEPVKGFQAFTDSADKWTADNQDLRRKYPNTFGLFAPSDGPFSITAWQHQLDQGDRRDIPPSELVQNANDRYAAFLYRHQRQELSSTAQGLNDQGRAQLASYKDHLSQQYPGYKPDSFDTGKNPALIAELQLATADPKLRASAPTTSKAVASYLDARDKALNVAHGSGLTGKDDEEIRRQLRQIGDDLARKYRGFGRVFDSVFAQEVK